MGKYLDGKKLAEKYEDSITASIQNITANQSAKRRPCLRIVQLGNNPASNIYIERKKLAGARMGFEVMHMVLSNDIFAEDLLNAIKWANEANYIDGIIVQMPLPTHINQQVVIETISPDKDVDGFHPLNMGKLAVREPRLRPCTPYGVMMLLDSVQTPFKGSIATVVGASNHVGRAMALELLLAGATVSVAHRFTEPFQLKELTQQSDIVVSAVGKPNFITKEHIKRGATVIDVGITRTSDGKIVGDVADNVIDVAKYVSPVPGGVGPMTVAMLFYNCLRAYMKSGGGSDE